MVPETYYIALSAILFTIGALGVLIRRNALIIFMSVELMLNAANVAFVAFANTYHHLNGSGSRPGADRSDFQDQAKHRRGCDEQPEGITYVIE